MVTRARTEHFMWDDDTIPWRAGYALDLLKQCLLELQTEHGRVVHVVVQLDDLGAHKHGGAG